MGMCCRRGPGCLAPKLAADKRLSALRWLTCMLRSGRGQAASPSPPHPPSPEQQARPAAAATQQHLLHQAVQPGHGAGLHPSEQQRQQQRQ